MIRSTNVTVGLAVAVVGAVAVATLGWRPATSAPASTLSPDVVDLVTRTGNYPADASVVSAAEQRLTSACMSGLGLPYVVAPAGPPSQSPPVDIGQRQRDGYGLADRYTVPQGQDPASTPGTNDYYVAHLSAPEQAAYLTALRGDGGDRAALRLSDGKQITYPLHGCEARSRQQLYGSLLVEAQVTYVPQIVQLAVVKGIRQDPRYVAALHQWSACMSIDGDQFSSPDDARQQLATRYQQAGATAGLRRREIAVAVRDGQCADRVRLTAATTTAQEHYLSNLPTADQQELRRLTTLWHNACGEARHVVATPDRGD